MVEEAPLSLTPSLVMSRELREHLFDTGTYLHDALQRQVEIARNQTLPRLAEEVSNARNDPGIPLPHQPLRLLSELVEALNAFRILENIGGTLREDSSDAHDAAAAIMTLVRLGKGSEVSNVGTITKDGDKSLEHLVGAHQEELMEIASKLIDSMSDLDHASRTSLRRSYRELSRMDTGRLDL